MTTSPETTTMVTRPREGKQSGTNTTTVIIQSPYARPTEAGNGYDVISQHPVPESVRNAISNAMKDKVLPLVIGLLVSAIGFFLTVLNGVPTPLILMATVLPTMIGCARSHRVESQRKTVLRHDPAVIAMSERSGIPAEEIALVLFSITNGSKPLPRPVREDTLVFINTHEFDTVKGSFVRSIPKSEQSIGLMRKTAS